MNAAVRNLVKERAGYRCEYCRLHRDYDPQTFHVEHIVPKKHRGASSIDNLCLSCGECNQFKGTDFAGLLGEAAIRLFNPRRQLWTDHFRIDDGKIIGITECGRVTEILLRFNLKRKVILRRLLIAEGLYP